MARNEKMKTLEQAAIAAVSLGGSRKLCSMPQGGLRSTEE